MPLGLSQEVVFMTAFCWQAQTANQRGIEFLFTFAEWVNWWETNLGPGWFAKRGRGWKQYCMARIGDTGPYSLQNVKCVTNEENSKDRNVNRCFKYGEQVNTAKLTEHQVRDIYLSTGNIPEMARKYGMGYRAIKEIRTGYRWGHVTQGLGPPTRPPVTQKRAVSCRG